MEHQEGRIGFWAIPPTGGPINGYSYAGLKLVQTLSDLGHPCYFRDEDAPVSISFCQPHWYSQTKSQFRVGYTPWESTGVPKDWVPHMNAVDLIWTTSHFCKEVFEEAGVLTDIEVVPHGIDVKEWQIHERKPKNKFVFFHMGEPAFRKGGQMVVDAFIKVFGNIPDAYLYVKAHESADCRLQDPFRPIDSHPRIYLEKRVFTVEQLSNLYNSVDCMVYPSNGEGFGLIPFQAIATGMPTLLVDWGGVKEFGHWGIPIDYTVRPTEHGYHLGDWAYPDFESVCDQMWYAYTNREKLYKEAYINGEKLRNMFRWEDILSKAIVKLPF